MIHLLVVPKLWHFDGLTIHLCVSHTNLCTVCGHLGISLRFVSCKINTWLLNRTVSKVCAPRLDKYNTEPTNSHSSISHVISIWEIYDIWINQKVLSLWNLKKYWHSHQAITIWIWCHICKELVFEGWVAELSKFVGALEMCRFLSAKSRQLFLMWYHLEGKLKCFPFIAKKQYFRFQPTVFGWFKQ